MNAFIILQFNQYLLITVYTSNFLNKQFIRFVHKIISKSSEYDIECVCLNKKCCVLVYLPPCKRWILCKFWQSTSPTTKVNNREVQFKGHSLN